MKINNLKRTSLNYECFLIKNKYAPDKDDFDVPEITEKKLVFCGKFSVGYSEYYAAAQEGLALSFGIMINSDEDNGCDQVEFDGTVYDVQRKFERIDGYTEVYLMEE